MRNVAGVVTWDAMLRVNTYSLTSEEPLIQTLKLWGNKLATWQTRVLGGSTLGVGEGEFRGKGVEVEVPVRLLEQLRRETTRAKKSIDCPLQ